MPFHDTATTSNFSQERGGNTRKRKKSVTFTCVYKVWGISLPSPFTELQTLWNWKRHLNAQGRLRCWGFWSWCTLSQRTDENCKNNISSKHSREKLSSTVLFPSWWLWVFLLASLYSRFQTAEKRPRNSVLAFMENFTWGQSNRVWGLQKAPQPKRNSAQVLASSPAILQLRLSIFNSHIKLCWWKRLLHWPTCHCLTVDLLWRTLQPKQMRTA